MANPGHIDPDPTFQMDWCWTCFSFWFGSEFDSVKIAILVSLFTVTGNFFIVKMFESVPVPVTLLFNLLFLLILLFWGYIFCTYSKCSDKVWVCVNLVLKLFSFHSWAREWIYRDMCLLRRDFSFQTGPKNSLQKRSSGNLAVFFQCCVAVRIQIILPDPTIRLCRKLEPKISLQSETLGPTLVLSCTGIPEHFFTLKVLLTFVICFLKDNFI